MRRLFWLSVGAGLGVYATQRVRRRVRRLARTWTPDSVAARAGGRIRLFAADVARETRAREAQLRAAVEIDRSGLELEESPPRRVLRGRYTIIDEDKDGH